jgi:uroporphyrinogen-III decarboxylase
MDLVIEKETILDILNVPPAERASFHFDAIPDADVVEKINSADFTLHPRTVANIEALKYIAQKTDLFPVDMSIGPFSLLTKMMSDPITAIYLSGTGLSIEDAPEVALVEKVSEIALKTVLKSIKMKIEAGAKAIFLCEPAANLVYFSPKQMEEGSDVFDRFVIEPNRQIKKLLDDNGVSLILHDCGDLKPVMVQKLASLHPDVFSFGSPVKMWEMEPFVAKDIVMLGNLPTKKFYSDTEISIDEVKRLSVEIIDNMKSTGHPFMLGSECDILSMPGYEKTIIAKVKAFCSC